MGGATPTTDSLYSVGEYFLQTALHLTFCYDQVVSRVMHFMLCWQLIAQMVMSVTRQVVQIGFCTGMTRTGCNRRVSLLGTKQFLLCTFSLYSVVGMYLSDGRFLLCFHLVCFYSII